MSWVCGDGLTWVWDGLSWVGDGLTWVWDGLSWVCGDGLTWVWDGMVGLVSLIGLIWLFGLIVSLVCTLVDQFTVSIFWIWFAALCKLIKFELFAVYCGDFIDRGIWVGGNGFTWDDANALLGWGGTETLLNWVWDGFTWDEANALLGWGGTETLLNWVWDGFTWGSLLDIAKSCFGCIWSRGIVSGMVVSKRGLVCWFKLNWGLLLSESDIAERVVRFELEDEGWVWGDLWNIFVIAFISVSKLEFLLSLLFVTLPRESE